MKYITVLLMLAVVSCSNPPARFVIGDVVCVKGLDSRGVIKFITKVPLTDYTYTVIFEGGNQAKFGKSNKLLSKCK